jgi:hypothetical protein
MEAAHSSQMPKKYTKLLKKYQPSKPETYTTINI